MKELEGYREALKSLPEQIKEAEAEAEKTVRTQVTVSGGAARDMGFCEKTELYIQAAGEKAGMFYTENLSEDPMEAIWQAYRNSLQGEEDMLMNTPGAYGAFFPEENCREWEAWELARYAQDLEEKIKAGYGKAGKTEIRAAQLISSTGVVNSKGMDIFGKAGRFDVTVSVAHRDDPMKVYEETVTARTLLDIHPEYFLEQLEEWEETFRPQASFTPGTYRAVLSSQAVNFLLTTGWQIFSAAYCQNGSSPLAGRLGEKVFSGCITIRDDKDRGYPFLLDAQGTPCQNVTVAKNGIFTGCLHNLATAAREGCASTGNGGRRALLSGNIHTDMTIVPKNFILEAGENTLARLLEKCGDGIYIYEAYDQFHSLDRITGDFHFPCKGILVENGRLAGSVGGLTMNGNIVGLLKDAQALGNKRRIEPMAIYENYLVSAPAMLVKSLRVSG